MPPWFADPRYGHFANERRLTQRDVNTLVSWSEAGAPEGDSGRAPAPVAFPPDGWNIKPDKVFAIPQPYEVGAERVIEYT